MLNLRLFHPSNLYGGESSHPFVFGKQTVQVSLQAENWIWPWTDTAKVTITSPSPYTYYGFYLMFVWTNDSSKAKVWRVPNQYSVDEEGPLKLLEPNESGLYKITLDMKCNNNSLAGSAGQSWACEQIEVVFSVRIGDQPVQTYTFDPVHF